MDEALVRVTLYGLCFLIVLTFLIFLLSGEFRNEIYCLIDHLRRMQELFESKYKRQEERVAVALPGTERSLDSHLREVRYLQDLAKIDLCVLSAEERILTVVAEAKNCNRGE